MVVSRFQARAAMHLAGILTGVESAVMAADPLTQIAWADATEFRRTSPTISAIAEALELTEDALDDLFRNPSLTHVPCCLRFAGPCPIEELPLPPNADKLRQSPAPLGSIA